MDNESNNDLFILIPFYVEEKKCGVFETFSFIEDINPKEDEYLKNMKYMYDSESQSTMTSSIKRSFCGKALYGICFSGEDSNVIATEKEVYVYSITHGISGLCVITIIMRNINLCSLDAVLDQINRNDIKIIPEDSKRDKVVDKSYSNIKTVSIDEWLNKRFSNIVEQRDNKPVFIRSGRIRTFCSMVQNSIIEAESLYKLLSGEDCLRFNRIDISKINSDIIKEQAKNNISQYDTFSIFASKTVVLQLIDEKMNFFDDSNFYNSLIIFPLEIIMLQEAAINRANNKIINALVDNDFSVVIIKDISVEFLKTLTFWDINFFKYKTMQNITEKIIKAFEIEKTKQMYKENQELLENLINTYSTISAEKESKVLNSIAILFAFIGAIPLSYAIIESIISPNHIGVKTVMLSTLTLSLTAIPIIMIVIFHNEKRLLKRQKQKKASNRITKL